MMGLLTLQRFSRRPLLGAAAAIGVMTLVFSLSYSGSDYFRQRTDAAIHQLANYESEVDSAVGLRIMYNINSWRIFSEHPLAGVGTGDFRSAYSSVNERFSPQWTPTHNPHSQYFLALTTTGVLGGMVLLLVLLPPALLRIPYRDGFDRMRIALPLLYLTICALESYLWRTNTSLMFVLFSALLYGDTEKFGYKHSGYAKSASPQSEAAKAIAGHRE
jgi:O-antigen ligase